VAKGLLFRTMEKCNRTITVFTPTYNRAHTLPRTYMSLRSQSCKDFLWLIIDDGSTDNTQEIVRNWQQQNNGFEIKYIYKENGGMHTAYNTAYENMDTELSICIDSDDKLADDAINKIISKWSAVKDKGYAGIIALNADYNGNVSGCRFPDELSETTISGFYTNGGTGDKKLIWRNEIIRRYPPYPVFEGEKYVAIAYLHRLVDQDYNVAVLNDVVCNVEYQPDGSTKTMWQQYLNSPKGFAFWRKICLRYPTTKKRMIVDCIHYISSSIIAKNKHFIKESPKKLLTVMLFPFGFMLSLITRIKGKIS